VIAFSEIANRADAQQETCSLDSKRMPAPQVSRTGDVPILVLTACDGVES
jgi:hypothetical protein